MLKTQQDENGKLHRRSMTKVLSQNWCKECNSIKKKITSHCKMMGNYVSWGLFNKLKKIKDLCLLSLNAKYDKYSPIVL